MNIKPFIRWAGGKQNLANEILKHFPDNYLLNKYYEPFVGAGSVFFASKFSNAFISDVNSQLINTYSSIKTHHIEVFNLLSKYNGKFKRTPEYYYNVRSLFNRDKEKHNYIQAARFIFLLHTNYNGMFRVNQNGDYNVPIGKLSPAIPSLDQLKSIKKKITGTTIRCFDYKEILNYVEKNDFVYIDPPYPPLDWTNPQNQFTVANFAKKDHEEIAAFANKLRQLGCFVLISYPDMNFITELYPSWKVERLNAYRSISCKKERKIITELLIKNY